MQQTGQLKYIAVQGLMEMREGDLPGRFNRRRNHNWSFMICRLESPQVAILSLGCAGGCRVFVGAALVSMAAYNE